MRPTLKDIEKTGVWNNQANAHLHSGKPKKHKYAAQKTEADGVMLDSKKEAKRYKELRLLLRTGQIKFLARQVEYQLNPGGTFSLIYKADFVWQDKEGNIFTEDCKGYRTKEYLKKKKLMKKIHGIDIKET